MQHKLLDALIKGAGLQTDRQIEYQDAVVEATEIGRNAYLINLVEVISDDHLTDEIIAAYDNPYQLALAEYDQPDLTDEERMIYEAILSSEYAKDNDQDEDEDEDEGDEDDDEDDDEDEDEDK